MSFDELPPDAQPPRLEEGDDRATDREASASDAPPAAPSRRRRAPRTGTDAASTETTPSGEPPVRATRRRAPAEAKDKEMKEKETKSRETKRQAARETAPKEQAEEPSAEPIEEPSVVSASDSVPLADALSVEPSASAEETDTQAVESAPAEAAPRRRATRKTAQDVASARQSEGDSAPTTAEPEAANAETAKSTRRSRRKPAQADAETISSSAAQTELSTADSESAAMPPADAPASTRPTRRRSIRAPKEVPGAEVVTPNTTENVLPVPVENTAEDVSIAAEDSALVEAATAASAASAPETILPPVKRGRQRRRNDTTNASNNAETQALAGAETLPAQVETFDAPTIIAETQGITVEPDAETGEDAAGDESDEVAIGENGEPRSRRRRNRRNNRGKREPRAAEAAAIDVQAKDAPERLEAVAELVVEAVIVPPLPLVVEEPIDLTVGAHLITQNGVPQIHLNGVAVPPVLFFGNMEGTKNAQRVVSEVRRAARAGVHLHSTLLELPCPLSEASYVLDDIDIRLRSLLDADPEGHLMPRLVFVPARGWKREYPTEISQYSDGTTGDPSLTSARFWQEAERALEVLIQHIQTQTYGERVFGYHLERGEWFQPADQGYDRSMANRDAFRDWLREKYKDSLILLRAAWYDGDVQFHTAEIPPPLAAKPNPQRAFYETRRERSVIDFNEFTSESTANRLALLARAVKKASRNNALVSVCYGYTLEFGHDFSGHLALDRVLASPHIDLITGPPSYRDRKPAGAASFPSPVDSPPLHGKLWLSEDDTKTYLAPAVQDPEDFNPRLSDRFATEQAQSRAMGRALATNTGIGWMDLWGEGWLDEDNMWERIGQFTDRLARQQREVSQSPATSPDVVILVDEKSLLHVQKGELFFRKLTNGLRDTLQRSGVAYKLYLQSDVVASDFPTGARLYLFLNPYRLTGEQRTAIKEKLQRDNKTLAWLYAPASCEERPTGGSGMEEVATGTVGLTLRQQAWNSEVGSRILDPNHVLTERLPSRELGTRERLNPSFYVDDPGATVLAEYQNSCLPSIAVRNFGNWRSVFVGDPVMPLELLRGICRYAGVHLYASAGEDVITIGNGWINVHAARDGQRTLRLPSSQAVYDMQEQRLVAEDTKEYRYFLRMGMTKTFCIGTRERFARLDLPNLSVPIRSRSGGREENTTIAPATPLSVETPDRVRAEANRTEATRTEAYTRGEETPLLEVRGFDVTPDEDFAPSLPFAAIAETAETRLPEARDVADIEDEPEPFIEPFPEPRRVPTPPSSIINPALRADLETLKAVLEMQMPDDDEGELETTSPPIAPLPLPKDGLPGLEAVLGTDLAGRRRRRRGGRGRGRRPLNGSEEEGEANTSSPEASGNGEGSEEPL